tara:strand:- start:450 stop:1853 length:1404 start_codon:yes stop_codon:yes gene_type:complete
MSTEIKFGTDGWRATPSTGLNDENIKICAQSFSDYINNNFSNQKTVLVGYDTRKDSLRYAELASQVIKSNGIDVEITNRATPTPLCSYHVKNNSMVGAVIITASHNSKDWNGFKVRSDKGISLNELEISEIEKSVIYYSENSLKIRHKDSEIKKTDVIDSYINSIHEIVDINSINNSKLSIVSDYMHGAVTGILEKILTNKNNIFLRSEINSEFPGMEQPEPIEGNLKNLMKQVKNNNSDIGFAFDGDGDRLGVIDENGNFQSASEVFLILSSHVLENKSSIKSIATTVSMTSNINEICKKYNSQILITKVGFKHLAPLLEEEKVSFAGEESGGYSMINHVSDKDGILSALLYLEYLVKSKKSPSESISTIYDKFSKKQFERIDNKFSEVDRKKIQEKIENLDTFIEKNYQITNKDFTDGKKFFIDNNSWILIRLSGTEPVFRIYIESPNKMILEEIKNQILEYFNN